MRKEMGRRKESMRSHYQGWNGEKKEEESFHCINITPFLTGRESDTLRELIKECSLSVGKCTLPLHVLFSSNCP